MTKLEQVLQNGHEKFGRKNFQTGLLEDKWFLDEVKGNTLQDLKDHERAIEIALLKDLVEEAKSIKPIEHDFSRLDDDRRTQMKNILNAKTRGHNFAIDTLITKYQDRIKKLKS